MTQSDGGRCISWGHRNRIYAVKSGKFCPNFAKIGSKRSGRIKNGPNKINDVVDFGENSLNLKISYQYFSNQTTQMYQVSNSKIAMKTERRYLNTCQHINITVHTHTLNVIRHSSACVSVSVFVWQFCHLNDFSFFLSAYIVHTFQPLVETTKTNCSAPIPRTSVQSLLFSALTLN